MAVERETHALGLHDGQRLQRRQRVGQELAVVIDLPHRDGGAGTVVDPNDLAGLDVDDGVQTLDGMGIEGLVVVETQPDEGVAEVAAFLIRVAEISGRPGIDANLRHIEDARARRRPATKRASAFT